MVNFPTPFSVFFRLHFTIVQLLYFRHQLFKTSIERGFWFYFRIYLNYYSIYFKMNTSLELYRYIYIYRERERERCACVCPSQSFHIYVFISIRAKLVGVVEYTNSILDLTNFLDKTLNYPMTRFKSWSSK